MNASIHRARWGVLAAGVALVAAAGFGIFGHGSMANPGGTASPGNQSVVSLSIAKEYATFAELRRDADLVALVTVAGAPKPSTRIEGLPTVDLVLRVEQVLAGTPAVGDTVTLVQVGDPSGRVTVADPIPPILREGKRYLVFLNRQFPEQPQMFITGQAGVYETDSGGQFRRLGDASPKLPQTASIDQF